MTNFITLNNGYQIPQLGFGTIQQFGKQIEDNVAFALNHGYQLIDTANRYGNEVEVGKGLKLSGLKRKKIVAQDGPSDYIRNVINSLSEEEFNLFIEYHLKTCERKELLGASSHILDIVEKKKVKDA